MSEIQAIAAKLRDLAESSGHLSTNVEDSVARLRGLAGRLDAIQRCGVDTGSLAGAIQAAIAHAQRAGDAVRQVRAEGNQWADTLASGSGGGQSGPGSDIGTQTETRPQSLDDIAAWLPDVNPGFTGSEFDRRSNNCGSCAAAVFARLNGTASPVAGLKTLTTPEMAQVTGRPQVGMSPSDISARLIKNGPGSHAVIGVDRSTGPGHWFNAYYDGKKVVTIDGQSGMISDWPPDYGDVTYWDAGF